MAYLHPLSKECTLSELSLWSVPSTQTSIESSKYTSYFPISTLQHNTPIEFLIGGSEDLLDTASILLCLNVTVTREDSTPILPPVAPNTVAIENNFLSSLFSGVSIFYNDRLVSSSNGDFGYISYIQNHLSYSQGAKSSYLSAAGYFQEPNPDRNLAQRAAMVGHEINLIGRLNADVLKLDRLLLSHVSVKINMTQARDSFSIYSTDPAAGNVRANINLAKLLVRKVRISPQISLAFASALEEGNARYPISKTQLRQKQIPIGVSSVNFDNLINGQLPDRIICGLVDHNASQGAYTRNSFNFEHCDLSFIGLLLNGENVEAYTPNFTTGSFIEAYYMLQNNLGITGKNYGNAISRSNYANGHAFYAWTLTQDGPAGCGWNLTRSGQLKLDLRFRVPTTKNLTLLIYTETAGLMELSKTREILFDWQ